MKPKNKKPTEIYCVEDLFKYCLFGQEMFSTFLNIISLNIVDLFLEMFDFKLNVVYFDYREYDPEFAKTHIKNALVEFKFNKKYIIFKQTYNIANLIFSKNYCFLFY